MVLSELDLYVKWVVIVLRIYENYEVYCLYFDILLCWFYEEFGEFYGFKCRICLIFIMFLRMKFNEEKEKVNEEEYDLKDLNLLLECCIF